MAFVDAHFGFGSVLDDLLWTMRILSQPKLVAMDHQAGRREQMQWADST
jgi:hypothetical protein